MAYGISTSIIVSLVIGAILTLFFDNIFIITIVGFIATYMVEKENKTYLIGIMAALIFEILNFMIGMIMSPRIPEYIASNLGFDFQNFLIGFIVSCVIAIILGFFGGFVAEKAYKRIYPDEFKNIET
ncbi:hypothetical protein MBCUT_12910 [Methanobrevibacter cuticularis]|uniref:Uncharacterized protein n=1 Tax=Methanobrevibacter cuticularis TaxID=47311 RepID=A0A166DNH1_9EURY|nr:hypothetical protein [Methanobrevibacter cuticularis]KZX15788.1 hypothetical protein MBCUT_12910 [Methanobrevibacter cuticularis]